MKLALGTAQFGMNYGITNSTGRVSLPEIKSILDLSRSYGINTLDTAYVYGNAEESLGFIIEKDLFQIITKTKPVTQSSITNSVINQIKKGIQLSFNRLQQQKIYGLLVHHGEELLLKNGERLFDLLKTYKEKEQISKIGVSVYTVEAAMKIVEKYPIDLIQVPLNMLDQRMSNSGMLKILKEKDIEIHVRSAFLQGVLLENKKNLSKNFDRIHEQLANLEQLSSETGVSKLAIALSYLKSISEIDKIIIGVLNTIQLEECVSAFNTDIPQKINYQIFECKDNMIINPSNWEKLN
ncbi:aldo/keto reductase [Legionella impletisoli]|uniref:Oxidoreductase n=1 Tax=Legionella impletisoli TaxID=343510 RepID=A0A917JQR4_9GAMM|nr:aldo/keto reductase [Legionella impletisoli]GGI82175.1 oxidoreductase [Legionella impletisoli]